MISKKIKHAGLAIFIFITLSSVFLWVITGKKYFASVSASDETHSESAEKNDHHDESEKEENNESLDLDSLEKQECEHKIRTIDCNNCRFELGVVKIEPSIAKSMISTTLIENRPAVNVLKSTGEVQLDKNRMVTIQPITSGRVIQINAFLGQKVKQGDVLAIIHSADFSETKTNYLMVHTNLEIANKNKELQASISASIKKLIQRFTDQNTISDLLENSNELQDEITGEWKSKLSNAHLRLELARSVFEREKKLWETQISSKVDYENANQELKLAQIEFSSLIQQAELDIRSNELKVDNAIKQSEAELNAIMSSSDISEAKANYIKAFTNLEIAYKEKKLQSSISVSIKKLLRRFKDQNIKNDTADNKENTNKVAHIKFPSLDEMELNIRLNEFRAESEVKQAETELNAVKQKLHILGLTDADINKLINEKHAKNFAELEIKATKTGKIIVQNITEGAQVNSSVDIYTIADLSTLWVICNIYEKDIPLLENNISSGKNIKAIIRVSAFSDKTFSGSVDLIESVIDEHTRTGKVRIKVKNNEGKLKPGMFANIEILIPSEDRINVVPCEAVLSNEGKHFVFQHWKEDLWVRRDVEIGRQQGDFIEIKKGLNRGVTIVTKGAFMLKSDILRSQMGAGCAD